MSIDQPHEILSRINLAGDAQRGTTSSSAGLRGHLLADLMRQSRRLSTLSTLFAQSTADHLGMNLSDMLCLSIISGAGPMTLGQLASMMGLSTGSITGLVDRLERLDLVRRQRDVEDRRRIMIHLNPARSKEIGQAFVPMLESRWQHLEQFTDDELGVISRYLSGSIESVAHATEAIRSREKVPFAAPLPDHISEN